MDWKEVLDSPMNRGAYSLSWEEYIRITASVEGYLADGDVLPTFAYDERYVLEPVLVGFVFIPHPLVALGEGDMDITEIQPMFFDHDNVLLFEDFITYVYQFEEPDTWETDTELLLYHNRAAIFDEKLQEDAQEFGVMEVITAARRGQYDGHTSWVVHPDEC